MPIFQQKMENGDTSLFSFFDAALLPFLFFFFYCTVMFLVQVGLLLPSSYTVIDAGPA